METLCIGIFVLQSAGFVFQWYLAVKNKENLEAVGMALSDNQLYIRDELKGAIKNININQ